MDDGGNLVFQLLPDGRELLKENATVPDSWVFAELFEDFLANGWTLLHPADIGALTGCEIIVTDDTTVWWHERYQVESFTKRLLSDGHAILRKAE